MNHWWEEPLRILDYIDQDDMDHFDLHNYVRVCKELNANVVHFHTHYQYSPGLDEDGFYYKSRIARKQNRDLLGEAVPLLKDAGVRILVYFNGHWYPKALLDKHPDWAVIIDDGTRYDHLYGDDDTTVCLNSPWRNWGFTILEDLFQYDIDGIFFDGPITFLSDKACYCASCKEKFRAYYGQDIPRWDPENKEEWKLLINFAKRSTLDYYRDAYALIKRLKPEAVAYCNACNIGESGWHRGRQNRPLMPYQDMLGSEGGFIYSRLWDSMYKTSASSKIFQTHSGGKPCVNFTAAAYGPWRRHNISVPELKVLLAEASTGCNPYLGVFANSFGRWKEATADVYGFLAKNIAYYRGSKSAATVAILHSSQTVDYYTGVDVPYCDLAGVKAKPSAAIGNFTRSFTGMMEMLDRLRVPYDIIDEVTIERGEAAKYQMLLMPNCACLSEAQCRAIGDYVRTGGSIVADFETSHFDEMGARLPELGLAEVFGASSLNEVYGARRWDFVFLGVSGTEFPKHPAPDILRSVSEQCIPAPRHNLRVRATGDVAAVFSEPVVNNISNAQTPSDEPMLIVNSFGKGRSYYLPCTFSQMYEERHFVPYMELMGALIQAHVELPVTVTGVPHYIKLAWREQPDENRSLLHLTNYEIRPVTEAIPAYDIQISVRGQVTSARALKLGVDLPVTSIPGGAKLTLPRLDEYELVAIER